MWLCSSWAVHTECKQTIVDQCSFDRNGWHHGQPPPRLARPDHHRRLKIANKISTHFNDPSWDISFRQASSIDLCESMRSKSNGQAIHCWVTCSLRSFQLLAEVVAVARTIETGQVTWLVKLIKTWMLMWQVACSIPDVGRVTFRNFNLLASLCPGRKTSINLQYCFTLRYINPEMTTT